MSIHNKAEVPESETQGSQWTRDRLGKEHSLSDLDGASRLWRPKTVSVCVMTFLFVLAYPFPALARPNTDVQIESEDFDKRVLGEEPPAPDEPLTFYRDGDKSLILNDDVQPTMNLKF